MTVPAPLKSSAVLDDEASAMERESRARAADAEQGGFVLLVVLIAIVIPILLLAIDAVDVSPSNGLSQQASAFANTRAQSAAEAGLDDALFVANSTTGLHAGSTSSRNFGDGRTYAMTAAMAGSNLRVTVTGTWNTASRVLQMDLRPVATSPLVPPASSLTVLDKNATFQITGNLTAVDGHDHAIDGSAGRAANDKPGMVVEPPNTTADLLSMVASSSQPKITGVGPAPSFGVASGSTNLAPIGTSMQAAATVTLTNTSYSGYSFGNAATGDYKVTYRAGNVTFRGGSRGAGVLFVTGNLTVKGTFRFDGIVYVQGDFDAQGSAMIVGAVVAGSAGHHVGLQGTASVLYSATAVTIGSAGLSGAIKYTGFSGWFDVTP
jgi:hypothetical protein